MMRPLVSLAFCAALSLASAGSGDNLKSDPSYQAPVSIEMKIAPVGDVIKAIAKQAKLTVEPTMSLTDLKVTVFVKAQPAGLVLDKIANVLGCVWRNEQGLEMMVMTSEEKDRRQRYLDREDEVLRAEAEREAHNLADAAANATNLQEFAQNFSKDQPVQNFGPPGPVHFHHLQVAPPSGLMASPTTYALGKVWAGWSPGDWSAFWSGTVSYAEVTPDTPPNQNQDIAAQRMRLPAQYVFARYDAYGDHALQFAVPPHGSIPRVAFEEKHARPTGELASTPFGKEVLAWPDLSEADKDESFTKEMSPPASPEPVGPLIMADQLQMLYDRSGVPIVADAFRNQMPGDRKLKGSTPSAWLSSLQDVDQCFIRVEDGVAMVRQGRFWRLRQMEIPESLIKPLAQHPDRLTLADYANFLTALTPPQATSLSSLTPPLLDFPTEPIVFAIPALRFLGALGSIPPSDTPIPFAQLGGNAQQMFVEAIYDALFAGGNWTGTGPGPNAARYSFELKSGDVMNEGMIVRGVTLIFGTDPDNAVTYTIPFPP